MRNKTIILSGVVFTILIVILISCNKAKPDERARTISIMPTAQGWEIYGKDKELLLELTQDNTDSLSLETLKYIYEASQESPDNTEEEYIEEEIKKVDLKQNNSSISVNIALQK